MTYDNSANADNYLNGEHDEDIRLQAKALCDRTRYSIYNTICSSPEPLTVAELTAAFKLNHNAIRQHLAVLVNAGLVREELESKRANPGRPRLFYSAGERSKLAFRRDDHEDGRYSHLAILLAKAINSNIAPREMGRIATRPKVGQIKRQTTQSASNYIKAVDGLMNAMENEGFHTRIVKRGKRVELVIDQCPFIDIVNVAPQVMCDLHLGMAEGIAAATGSVRVVDLENRRTHNDGCHLVLQETNG